MKSYETAAKERLSLSRLEADLAQAEAGRVHHRHGLPFATFGAAPHTLLHLRDSPRFSCYQGSLDVNLCPPGSLRNAPCLLARTLPL